MSKFTLVTSLLGILLVGIMTAIYYHYVLDIEYHETTIISEDNFTMTLIAPQQVKKNQRFSVLAELSYTGTEILRMDRQQYGIKIDMINKQGEIIQAYSPIVYRTNYQEILLRPSTVISLNLEYKVNENGSYQIHTERRKFKNLESGEVLEEFDLIVPIIVGK